MHIFVDSREDGDTVMAIQAAARDPELLKTLKEAAITVEIVGNMESGDIVCGEYAIEHKKPADYRDSLFGGRLSNQIDAMKRNFKACAVLYSGHDYELFQDKIGTGSVASIVVQGVPVICCGNLKTMATLAIKMLHKWNDNKVREANPSINQKRTKDDQLNVITGIPGIAEKQGNALLSHFGSVEAIVMASIEELQAVDGIGIEKAKTIYTTLHSPRW